MRGRGESRTCYWQSWHRFEGNNCYPGHDSNFRLEFFSSMHYHAFAYSPLLVSHSHIIGRSSLDPDSIHNVGAILYPFPAIIDPRSEPSSLFRVLRDMYSGVGIFFPTATAIIPAE